jgi:hypothetical protein
VRFARFDVEEAGEIKIGRRGGVVRFSRENTRSLGRILQREEGSTVPALAPRFLSRHTTSPLLLSALRIISFRSCIITMAFYSGNTVITVNSSTYRRSVM